MPWGYAAAAVVGAVASSDASKRAKRASDRSSDVAIGATEGATEQAREDSTKLFSQAREDSQRGFQGALDVFNQSLPAQTQAFQGGNIGAQEQLIAGLPLFQNAILGGQLDFSQLQPTQVQTPDLGLFQQQLPGTAPAGVDPATTSPATPNAFAPSTQFQGSTQDTGGFFGNLLNPAPPTPLTTASGFTVPQIQQLQLGGFGMGVGPSLEALAGQMQLEQGQQAQPPQPTNIGQGDQFLRRPNFLTGGF